MFVFFFCKVEVWVTRHTPIILCYHLGTCYDSVKKLYAFLSFLLFCRWPVNIVALLMLSIILCSPEAKQIVEDGLSDMAASLLAAYDSGELITALQEGPTGWQKWVKALGKAIKRKVNFPHCCTKKLSSYSYLFVFF